MGGSVRDAIKQFSPKWLASGVAEKFLYSFGLAIDVMLEKMNQAMRMHIPTYGDNSGLATIGNDRLIPQGANELPASYAARLKTAYDGWQLAGSARSLLSQVLGNLSPATPLIRVVSNGNSTAGPGGTPWDTYLSGATPITTIPSHSLVQPANWNWDGQGFAWWRSWFIIYSSSGSPFTNEGTWGDGKTYGDGGTWGTNATQGQVSAIQSILKLWKPANDQVLNVIINFDSTLFDMTQAFGSAKLPDSNFGGWAKQVGGVSVPARFASAAYWDGA